jgi:hypothetical protein
MAIYYVNDNALSNNEHIVHKEGCDFLSFMVSKTSLGEQDHINQAVLKAKEFYYNSKECEFCNKYNL